MSLRISTLAAIAVLGFAAFGVGWFELSVLADTRSLMRRDTLKVLMARGA
jgi:hypothetical protein